MSNYVDWFCCKCGCRGILGLTKHYADKYGWIHCVKCKGLIKQAEGR